MNRIISLLAKLLLALLLLLLTAFLSFWARNLHFIEGTDEQDMAYLSQNKQDLNLQLSDAGPEAALFDSAFYEGQVFLLGENHGYADVQLIDRQLLLHLNRKAGLRYYLAEMDSIRAKKLNAFLKEEAKDTLLLKQVVKDISIRIPQQSSEELYQKWLAIYDYNRKLPDSLKIIVIGVDQDFEDTSRAISRHSMMLVNFKNAVKAKGLEKEKFYGLFGYTHVLQSGYGEKDIHPFAAKVKRSDLPFANRIQSIVCFTLDSEMALPKTDHFPSPQTKKRPSSTPMVLLYW